jgi:hypothetical protein
MSDGVIIKEKKCQRKKEVGVAVDCPVARKKGLLLTAP